MSFYQIIEILAVLTSAISGTSAAIKKQLDIFGVLIIAFATAIGGGTIRDVLIGNTPVAWMTNNLILYLIFGGALATIAFGRWLAKLNYSLFLFDSLGLGLFTLIGIQRGMEAGLSPGICIALGTITGCFGGVVRDVLLNDIPVIFRKEIYASASIIGGILFYLLSYLSVNQGLTQVICISLIVVIRILAVRKNLSLPPLRM